MKWVILSNVRVRSHKSSLVSCRRRARVCVGGGDEFAGREKLWSVMAKAGQVNKLQRRVTNEAQKAGTRVREII